MVHSTPILIYWNTNENAASLDVDCNFIDYIQKRLNANSFYINCKYGISENDINENDINEIYRFLNHDEYQLERYFTFLREYCEKKREPNPLIQFVNEESEANVKIIFIDGQTIEFENIENKKRIKFGIEYDIPIPYLTGIYSLTNEYAKFDNKRRNLLSYIGGSWRGPKHNDGRTKRSTTIENLHYFSNTYSKNYNLYDKLFCCPMLSNSHWEEGFLGWKEGTFSIKAKEVYLDSVFSWQPNGDTPTRRAFYEALLLGNIPVISKSSFSLAYKNLLIGEEAVKNVSIILDDETFFDSETLIIHLLRITQQEIEERRRTIVKIIPRLQWGLNTKENVITDLINRIRQI